MDPVTAKLIMELVGFVVPMLFNMGRKEDAERLQRLYTDAQKNWGELEDWGNSPTRPPSGQTFRGK
jgi:hypothetical protein